MTKAEMDKVISEAYKRGCADGAGIKEISPKRETDQ